MKASVLPWSGWLIGAAILGFGAAYGFSVFKDQSIPAGFAFLALLAIGVLFAVVGIIRMVKWALKD